MSWVSKYNPDAEYKANRYENLENELISYSRIIDYDITEVSFNINKLKKIVADTDDVNGAYVLRYESACNAYFTLCNDTIMKNLALFYKDLNDAISQCQSKKAEWKALIYTQVWEPEKVDGNVCQKF